MRVWEENKNVLTGVGISLLALLATYFVFISWFSRGTTEIHAAYSELGRKLDAGRRGPYDLGEATRSMLRSNEDLGREIENTKEQVEIDFHPWTEIPPEYSSDAGAYFFLKHAEQSEELAIECTKASPPIVLSDPDLGFPEEVRKGIVKDRDARENLRRLSIVRRLVLLLVKAGVAEIVKITPSSPVWTGPEGYPKFIREYPVSIHVRTRIDPLVRFLHDVRRPGEFFLVVREFDVQAFDPYRQGRDTPSAMTESLLSVVISAAGMRFASEDERPETPRGTKRPGAKVKRRVKAAAPLGH